MELEYQSTADIKVLLGWLGLFLCDGCGFLSPFHNHTMLPTVLEMRSEPASHLRKHPDTSQGERWQEAGVNLQLRRQSEIKIQQLLTQILPFTDAQMIPLINFASSCKLDLIVFSFRKPEWCRFLGGHQAFMNHCHSEEESPPGACLRWPISFRWTSHFDPLATNPSTRRRRKKWAVLQLLLVQPVSSWISKSCYMMATRYGRGAKLTASCFTLPK